MRVEIAQLSRSRARAGVSLLQNVQQRVAKIRDIGGNDVDAWPRTRLRARGAAMQTASHNAFSTVQLFSCVPPRQSVIRASSEPQLTFP
jgi:hypothetical protein